MTMKLSKPCPVGGRSGSSSAYYRTRGPLTVRSGGRKAKGINLEREGTTGALVDPQTGELASGYTGLSNRAEI